MKKTILVNLLGAAGSGKSTLACDVFAKLKRKGFRCEYVPEYAKNVVYEENYRRLANQLYIFSSQYFSLDLVRDKVDIVITDSPMVLSIFYNNERDNKNKVPEEIFNQLVLYCHSTFDNLNFLIKRNHEYKQEGRYQNESQAKQEEVVLENLLDKLGVDTMKLLSSDDCASKIVEAVEKRYAFHQSLLKRGPEIERKFKVKKLPTNFEQLKNQKIVQGYLSNGVQEVRVRSVDDKKFYVTEKIGNGLVREELEKEISFKEFAALFDGAKGRIIRKQRYFCPLKDGKIAEVDVYENVKEKNGKHLLTVEVEFATVAEAKSFEKPDWFGEELTGDINFKNSMLAGKAEKEKAIR
ncbi:MAG: AAA family ATPase [Clostridia bacterium]|nr:AAA family ATPase [Clostridia bacterium]